MLAVRITITFLFLYLIGLGLMCLYDEIFLPYPAMLENINARTFLVGLVVCLTIVGHQKG